jgi:radical SAM protein with 4Fe4S-binding SPASM domain
MSFNFRNIANRLRKQQLTSYPAPSFGIHHYLREDGAGKARLHLRLEKDGNGVLMMNASRIYHLNTTAAYMAYLCLEQIPLQSAVSMLTRRFRVSARQALEDFTKFQKEFSFLIQPGDVCPVCELGLETTAPFSDHPSAPYRMDLAITYRCNNDCAHCYNARPRRYPELNTAHWKIVLDRLWQLGIPHVVFTGGEPTLRSDLTELIACAQQLGQITGLNTNGRRLSDPAFVEALVSAGLDHVQITIESHDPEIHDAMVRHKGAWQETIQGIRNALKSRLFVMTNSTLLQTNSTPENLRRLLEFLAVLGVPTIGLNALIYSGHGLEVNTGLPETSLLPLLELARSMTEQSGQRLIWYTPTQYCHFDPLQLDLGVKGCTAALYNMCIEPDGSVIPCQSYYQSLGNILETSWDLIWNHELAIQLRERKDVPFACQSCVLLQQCGGGCPLARRTEHNAHPFPILPLQFDKTEMSHEPIP